MTKEKRLGRGLEALLGRVSARVGPPEPDPVLDEAAPLLASVESGPEPSPSRPAEPTRLPLDQIDSNPFQPRHDFDEAEIAALAENMRSHGLLQPVAVRRAGDRYQLIAGERRLRAAAKAGWSDIPVRLIEADDRQVAELAIVENLQRKDLNPLEKAASFQRYLEQYRCTQEELAGRLSIDRSTIANLIRLLELPADVQDAIRQGRITQGHARALLPLGDEREQLAFCRRIQDEGLSVRQTESLVQETIARADAEPLRVVGGDEPAPRTRRPASEHVSSLEQQFRAALGVKVTLSHGARGRGKLTIHFSNHDEFERIRRHICGQSGSEVRAEVG